MFYEIDVGKYGDKYIKKGKEKCQLVIINAFHSHQNLSSLSNFNQQVKIHWGTSDLDCIFSAKEEQQGKERRIKKVTGWGDCHLHPRSLDL